MPSSDATRTLYCRGYRNDFLTSLSKKERVSTYISVVDV